MSGWGNRVEELWWDGERERMKLRGHLGTEITTQKQRITQQRGLLLSVSLYDMLTMKALTLNALSLEL